jgi:ribosomal protein S18 acetylase RimI-like enzyme
VSGETFPVLLDGYTDLPPGKIANVVTFMERRKPFTAPPSSIPGLAVRAVRAPSTEWFRDIYRRVGENWLWFSRTLMADETLAALLRRPTTAILSLEREGAAMGLVELDFSQNGEVEIVSFGVVEDLSGTGAAHMLMEAALKACFRPGIERAWLHTCSFDHPAAIRFYRRHGFEAFKFAIEVSDDPRRAGLVPETAAPHVPLIR